MTHLFNSVGAGGKGGLKEKMYVRDGDAEKENKVQTFVIIRLREADRERSVE